ncbi:hypothetical protein I9W82_001337 [Candida metapsilosis]|uniref:RBR-type E3 ubiquitin transferase n=1 Tax=Candida metapsilosis TaxID=273372 RepID=A0A8H8DE39_9ASCO|nr:hypothetical protein I9W82_001337 [Candida metapsilosis]
MDFSKESSFTCTSFFYAYTTVVMDNEIEFSEDLNIQELQSCSFIFDKLNVDYHNLEGSIELPLQSDEGKSITLVQEGSQGQALPLASKKVKYLPPLHLKFKLLPGYPEKIPPTIKLSCSFLKQEKIAEVEEQLYQLWRDYKDRVIFSLIDYLRELSQSSIDELLPPIIEVTDFDQYNDIIAFDIHTKEEKFNNQTFTCEICQVGQKGINCTQFDDCLHVFCNACLDTFFTTSIVQGEVDKVHCPEYSCTKAYINARDEVMKIETWTMKDEGVKDMVMKMLTPPVSASKLKRLLPPDLVQRYLTLFKKSQYEMIGKLLPSRLVNCPRIGCDEVIFREDLNDKLVMCPKCKYAFCNDCRKSYHARFKPCVKVGGDEGKYGGIPIEDLEAYNHMPQGSHEKKILNAKYGRNKLLKAIDEYQMDKLFEQMLKQGTDLKECPGCGAVIEKFEGCNKMKCSECLTCFCFNCGTQIDNSYDHFTDPHSPCYKLLFFGMPGIEDE